MTSFYRENRKQIAIFYAQFYFFYGCIPFDSPNETEIDMITGKPSERRVLFAKSY